MKHLILILLSGFTALNSYSQTETTPNYMQVGYYGRLTGGILAGKFSNTSWQISNGFRFDHFELGMGIGIENYSSGRHAPIFFESRYNFTRKSTQPFIGVNLGYLAPLNRYNPEYSNGGLTAGANLGLSHFFTSHFGATWTIGYRFVEPANQQIPLYIYEKDKLEVRMGIIFR